MATTVNKPAAADSALWRDVCLASAWFHRAQILHTTQNNHAENRTSPSDDDDDEIIIIITTAEKALSLYQSCHQRVKKRSFATSLSQYSESSCNKSQQQQHHQRQPTNKSSSSNAFTINLELRMAQTLRFLALVHADAAAAHHHSLINSNSNGENVNPENAHLEAAIKYHDMAVSLLVGVFDDEEENETMGESINSSSSNNEDSNNGNEIREPPQQQQQQAAAEQQRGQVEIWESFSEESGNDENDDGGRRVGSRAMLTIRVPKNAKLNQHTLHHPPNDTRVSVTTSTSAATTQAMTFLFPTEDQRVRAIAVSLNALAELHARCGDDRAAMDSYREALEILRAATEEEDEEEEEEEEEDDRGEGEHDDDGGSSANRPAMMDATTPAGAASSSSSQQKQPQQQQQGLMTNKSPPLSATATTTNNNPTITISPVQADLANTLMNVGNFHLRRDELEAALNAYSTVWALHSGNSLEEEDGDTDAAAGADGSIAGNGSCASPPYLTTPRTPRAPETPSFSTPDGDGGVAADPSSSSTAATPNGNNADDGNNDNCPSSSPGALVALNNLGIVHERRGELREALSCFEHVHRMRLQVLGREHADTVHSLINIGNCYQRLQEWERAGMAYGDSVCIYRKVMRTEEDDEQDGLLDPSTESDNRVRCYRSLAGALRNWGTCYWKQRRISEAVDCLNEAVDMEGKIVSFLSGGEHNSTASTAVGGGGGGPQDIVRQAKESTAQLLGLLGCLYLEYKLAPSFDESVGAFQWAIQLYEELGYDSSHPSIVWARHNLVIVAQLRAPPPPPPPTLPSMKPTTAPTATFYDDGVVDMDDIDSVELERVLATDDDENNDGSDDDETHDIFVGIEPNSTDELDRILSEETGAFPSKEKRASFEEEVHSGTIFVDEAVPVQSNHEHIGQKKMSIRINKPPSIEHRNISSSLFSDQGQEGTQQHPDDDDQDERVSQLQLQTGSNEGESIEAAHAHVALAEHFWEKGDRVNATEHYTEAHSIYQEQIGDCNEHIAMVLKKLGDLNEEDGALDAAKELYGEALEMELTVHGQYLPQTLNAAGAACLKNDDFRSAMDFHRRALQIQKKSHAAGGGGGGGKQQKKKYEMYETLVRIGNVYYSERNNFTHIQSNGVDYREFIESGFLGWIANAHDMRGEYIKAIQFYEESLEISMSRKGKEALRERALTLNRLGSLKRELGRYDEAMDYHQQALNIQKSGSGVAKAMTAETCVLMGMVKSKMGEFKSALDLYEDSLLVLKNALGEDHSSSWKTMAQIGSVHFELSNYKQAMAILLEAERWQLASVGDENRDTLETQALLGRVLSATGKYEMALQKLRDVYERQRKLFCSEHPAIADTLAYIGESFLDQGMATEARGKFVDCYNMRKKFFTDDQIQIAETMVDIIRARNGQPERALAIYRNAMDVYKENLPDDHVQIGRLYVYEGDSYAELLNIPTAIERYEQAKEVFYKIFGGECAIDSALVRVNIGKVLLRKCEFDAAKTTFTSALNIYQQILPEGHQKIISTLKLFDVVEQEEDLCV